MTPKTRRGLRVGGLCTPVDHHILGLGTNARSYSSLSRRENNDYPVDIVDELQDQGLNNLATYLESNAAPNCTLETAAKRMEW